LKTSVIICTKNRPAELAKCIKSVESQSLTPDEIVVVDGGDTQVTQLKLQGEMNNISKLKYVRSNRPSYLTADRNIGVKNSTGDIIVFVDDDSILDRSFLKEIVSVFERDADKRIGGVMGQIANIQRVESIFKNPQTTLRHLVQSVFLLPKTGDGRFLASGSPTYVHGANTPRYVEFLSGCCMAYRKEVFECLEFDEAFLEGHLYTDDEDFSYRVSRKYRNVYTPYAKLTHNPSPIGRDRKYVRAKMTVRGRHYLLRKNFPHNTRHVAAFWWSVIGLFILALSAADKESARGVINGATCILNLHGSQWHRHEPKIIAQFQPGSSQLTRYH